MNLKKRIESIVISKFMYSIISSLGISKRELKVDFVVAEYVAYALAMQNLKKRIESVIGFVEIQAVDYPNLKKRIERATRTTPCPAGQWIGNLKKRIESARIS